MKHAVGHVLASNVANASAYLETVISIIFGNVVPIEDYASVSLLPALQPFQLPKVAFVQGLWQENVKHV